MLTAQKRKFALALMSGSTQAASAIKAGYSEKSARSKGSQLAKDPEVIAFIERKKKEEVEVDDEPQCRRNVYSPTVNTAESRPPPASLPPLSEGGYEDPMDFLRAVMNNVGYEIDTRKDAAKAMLPYMHQKKGEGGKKDAKAEAAKKAANKFAIQQPPKLVVNNREK